jgi:hypothetical protein
MTQQNPAAVCRSISLQIENTNRWGRRGQIITPVPAPTTTRPVSEFLGLVCPDAKIEHFGRAEMVGLGRAVEPSSLFFQAVHKAFADHHPLALRPEVLMYLITSTIAETVRRHPEEYRHLFTTSDDRQLIEVYHNDLVRGDASSPWHEVFPMFNAGLREKVPAGIMEHMLPGFSTATPETDAASMACFMDATSKFYDYLTHTMCGIPEIRLLGTPEDWQKLKTSAAMLAEVFSKHLGLYFQYLLPVLTTLAAQANGEPQDDQFWSSFYKFQSESGTDVFNGWISAFLNYIQTPKVEGTLYTQARDGQIVQKADDLFDWRDEGGGNRFCMKGLPSGCAPSHVSIVPFKWNYYGDMINMSFAGGVLGVDNEGGYITPALSYAVLEAAK